MNQRALVFFPYLPYPVRDGAQRRCAAMLRGLTDLGYEVTLLVSAMVHADALAPEAVTETERALDVRVRVYTPGPGDYSFIAGVGMASETGWDGYTTPGLYGAFRELAASLAPDVALVNYAYWSALAHRLSPEPTVRLVDMHDLVSLHVAMTRAIGDEMPPRPVDPARVPDAALSETFFEERGLAVSARELAAYEAFDGTLAISKAEAGFIASHTRHTTVSYVPMAIPAAPVGNTYDAAPVYVISDTWLNLQGYAYFARQVLPRIRARVPDFRLRVVGRGGAALVPVDGIDVVGPVEALDAVYAGARFAVCPLLGGTGQQVKIVEAMAHGVPVVALKHLAGRSPVVDGVSGFGAENAEAFADACVRLWREPHLASRLGAEARGTIERDFHPAQLTRSLGGAIDAARERAARRMRDGDAHGVPPRFLRPERDITWTDGRRVAIYGAGSLGRRCRARMGSRATILGFVDSDPAKRGSVLDGLPVVGPQDLDGLGIDLVLVASMYWAQILDQLQAAGWAGERVQVF